MDFLPLRIIVVIHLYFNVQLDDIYFILNKYFGSGWEFGGLFSLCFAGFFVFVLFFICFWRFFFGGGVTFFYHLFQIISYIHVFLIYSILHVFI